MWLGTALGESGGSWPSPSPINPRSCPDCGPDAPRGRPMARPPARARTALGAPATGSGRALLPPNGRGQSDDTTRDGATPASVSRDRPLWSGPCPGQQAGPAQPQACGWGITGGHSSECVELRRVSGIIRCSSSTVKQGVLIDQRCPVSGHLRLHFQCSDLFYITNFIIRCNECGTIDHEW